MDVQSEEGKGTAVIIDLPVAANSLVTNDKKRATSSWLES
jgi:hypothetical protein